ncbi:MAG: ABC transporter ATP-binding protein [Lachnospiraceae bacterium]|nr:ABC transporter ATP-binding protein [Lachnospiraceae bacterium]
MITIDLQNLNVTSKELDILKNLAFHLNNSEAVGIVGESGSGKSMFVRSLIGLLPIQTSVSGTYRIDNKEISLNAKEKQWRTIRGKDIGMIMQDPFTALDPAVLCGKQILVGVPKNQRRHFDLTAALTEVGLPTYITKRYPTQLSGGQRQRVVIAAALATKPRLLVADEATTALDVITQKEILDLICNIQTQRNMPLILITHNILLAKQRTKRIFVLEQGKIVEQGNTTDVLTAPKQKATKKLLDAHHLLLDAPYATGATREKVILCCKMLSKRFGQTQALNNVDITVDVGECVGIVGESGSGKTTLGRCIVGLTKPDFGFVNYFGTHSPQMIFQDPYNSLNPAHTIRYMLEEALTAAGRAKSELEEIITLAEIPTELLQRKPAGLSGGQRQRVAIARALAPRPDLMICDESVSALDVKVQNQILHMIQKLRKKQNLAVLFITHDLAVLKMIAGRVYVMHQAKIVEHNVTKQILENAQHPYTQKLIAASEIGVS